jgi:hypothetical protein
MSAPAQEETTEGRARLGGERHSSLEEHEGLPPKKKLKSDDIASETMDTTTDNGNKTGDEINEDDDDEEEEDASVPRPECDEYGREMDCEEARDNDGMC